MEAWVLRDHKVVLEHSLDEVLAVKKVLELLEVNRILWRLAFESVDECLKLVMAVHTTSLDVIEDLMFEEIATVFTVKGLEGAACPGSGPVLCVCGSSGLSRLMSGAARSGGRVLLFHHLVVQNLIRDQFS
jgi:hypothetical protein